MEPSRLGRLPLVLALAALAIGFAALAVRASAWTPVGWALGVVVVAAISFESIRAARRAGTAPYTPVLTGRVLVPNPSNPIDDVPARWIGSVELTGRSGHRFSAPWPCAVLEVESDGLRVRVRPGFVASWLGVEPLVLRPDTLLEAFPARARLGREAIGLRRPDAPVTYFSTGEGMAVLSTLASVGYRVAWQEHRLRSWG